MPNSNYLGKFFRTGYQVIITEDGSYYPNRLKDVEEFSRMWARNIREQGWLKGAKVKSISHPELTAVAGS